MTFPPDGTMLTLVGLWTGETVEVRAGELYLTLPGHEAQPIPPAVLDQLEDRGWIEIGEAGPRATERGKYALDKWFTAKHRSRGGRGCVALTAARISPRRD